MALVTANNEALIAFHFLKQRTCTQMEMIMFYDEHYHNDNVL